MIRNAAPEDASTLTAIVLDAESYWGYPENWIKQSDLTVTPEFIRDNHVYVHEADAGINGFYALSVSGELEHIWVRPAMIGTGIGKELFLDAMERAQRHKENQPQKAQKAQNDK